MNKHNDHIRASATWTEIHAQPTIWRNWAREFKTDELRAWMDGLGIDQVWFCGAGTSAYIGDIITAGLPIGGGIKFRSVPSTDLVARPGYYLGSDQTPLIVNFGRSGNSSESVGTLDALRVLAPEVATLNITCNADSALALATSGQTVVLPAACHDAGFAMTSSFSTMLLTALAIFDRDADGCENIEKLADLAETALPKLAGQMSKRSVPARTVFVGSGPMAFAARESALKVMELSAGQIPSLWDSTLGFRHGPKSFVTDDTQIFVLENCDENARRYDDDLVDELRAQFPNATTTTIGQGGELDTGTVGSAVWDTVTSVLPAQMASVIWSAKLGLNIDDPFVGQSTLSRVVSGVNLHPIKVA